MNIVRRTVNNHFLFWLLLALPGIGMTTGYMNGKSTAEMLLHPTGEFSARFMIIAMIISPLLLIFPKSGFLKWLFDRRRDLGVAAFGYAVLHLVFYIIDMQTLSAMLAEFWALGIWTGWVAFIIFVPLAVTSNDASMRLMRQNWKWLHRWVYAAAVLTLVHWIFVHNNFGPALVHFVPLLALELYRIYHITRRAPSPT